MTVAPAILLLTMASQLLYLISKAGIAQLVEHKLPKLGVAGSSPVARSKIARIFPL